MSCLYYYGLYCVFQLQQSSHGELLRVLKILDQALEPRTFLVGESVSLADMAVVTALLLPFKYVSLLSLCKDSLLHRILPLLFM